MAYPTRLQNQQIIFAVNITASVNIRVFRILEARTYWKDIYRECANINVVVHDIRLLVK